MKKNKDTQFDYPSFIINYEHSHLAVIFLVIIIMLGGYIIYSNLNKVKIQLDSCRSSCRSDM